MKKFNNGFTLIEILIGITMAVFIFVATSTMLISIMTTSARYQKTEILEATKNDLAIDFLNYARWADHIEFIAADKQLNLEFPTENISYKLDNGRILKNGSAFTSKLVNIENYYIEEYGDGSFAINVDISHKEKADLKQSMKVVISPRNR